MFLQQAHQTVGGKRVGHPGRLVRVVCHIAEERLERLGRVQLGLLDQPAVKEPPPDVCHGVVRRLLAVQGAQPALQPREAPGELAEAAVVGALLTRVAGEQADALGRLLGPEGLFDEGKEDGERGLGRGQRLTGGQAAGEEAEPVVRAAGQFAVVPGVVVQGAGRLLVRRGQPAREHDAGLLQQLTGAAVRGALPDRVLLDGTDPGVGLGLPLGAGKQREVSASGGGVGAHRDDLDGALLAVGAVQVRHPLLDPFEEVVQVQGVRIGADRVRHGA